jgi:hypothetical protein
MFDFVQMRDIDYNYLMFRRLIIFLDEWFSYVTLIYLYYHLQERNKSFMITIIVMMLLFNLTGYYYLGLLEDKYGIYNCAK